MAAVPEVKDTVAEKSPGALADIAADVDDIDFVGHVDLALVLISEYHVCNHHQRQEDDDPKAESAIFR